MVTYLQYNFEKKNLDIIEVVVYILPGSTFTHNNQFWKSFTTVLIPI